jgi:RNA polymerase sigma factor (sigma-70 family)
MGSAAHDSIFSKLDEGRRQFLALVDDVRPELHRYCARMTGSIADGEDIVQDTLARAYYELSELKELPALRSWLFRIAHNRAIDYLRSNQLRMSESLEVAVNTAADNDFEPDSKFARDEAVHTALSRFVELAPAQRSSVILKDVLDYSLDEIATLLDLSVPAVKAALHRGRARLRELSEASDPTGPPPPVSPAVTRYAALFNARDWNGVRAMRVDDVKLDLVSRWKRAGRREVSDYFTNYDKIRDWHLVPGWLDGQEVLAVFRDARDSRASYFMELTVVGDHVVAIRDFRYVPYIAREARCRVVDRTRRRWNNSLRKTQRCSDAFGKELLRDILEKALRNPRQADVRTVRRETNDRSQNRNTSRVACGPAGAAQGREGADPAQRRAGATSAGTALGSDRQGVPIRDRRGQRLAGRPLPRALAAPRLPLHVRARLHCRLPGLLGDRRRLQRVRRAPGQP